MPQEPLDTASLFALACALTSTAAGEALARVPGTKPVVVAAAFLNSSISSETRLATKGGLSVYAIAGLTDIEAINSLENLLHYSQTVRKGLCRNPLTPPVLLSKIIHQKDPVTQPLAAMHPSTPSEDIDWYLTRNIDSTAYHLDAQRAAFAGTVMRHHLETLPHFAQHKDGTFRRLAARMPLDQAGVSMLYPPKKALSGRRAFLANPWVNAKTLPRWANDLSAAASAKAYSTALGPVTDTEAAKLASPSLDLSLSLAFTNGTLKAEHVGEVMFWMQGRGLDPEPDVVASLMQHPLEFLAAQDGSWSTSRLEGAAYTSLRAGLVHTMAAPALRLMMYSTWNQTAKANHEALTAALAAVEPVRASLGLDVDAWMSFLDSARTTSPTVWPELAQASQSAVTATPVKARKPSGRGV